MRKIEFDMLRAIKSEADRTLGNTRISCERDSGQVWVYLHGHCIAHLGTDDKWQFNLCGWNTPTTRSRINAIAREFGRPTVVTVRGTPYVSRYVPAGNGIERTEVPTNGWF